MKRWLKKHGRWLVVGLAVLFIANGSYGIFNETEELWIVVHVFIITVWLVIALLASGAVGKFYKWWEKD